MNISQLFLIAPVGTHNPDLRPAVGISIAIEGNLSPIRRPGGTVVNAVAGQFSQLASINVDRVNVNGGLCSRACRDSSNAARQRDFAAVRRPCQRGGVL